jgi:actin-related protein
MGGKEITTYLMKLLTEKGYSFTTTAEREIMRDIKEKLCYVAFDFEKEMNKNEKEIEIQYELPDSQIITVGKERFKATEALFDNSFLKNSNTTQKSIFFSIIKNEKDLSKQFYENIVLSGGNTMFSGISERIEKELKVLVDDNSTKIKTISPPERKYSVWIGGSIISSLSTFVNEWITKEQYEEIGPTVVHLKCL